ncbi:hypothetical protein B0H14DRAFT_2768624, partial [Mycena olivaceomarginata]
HIFMLFPSSSADLLSLTSFTPTFALFSSHCGLPHVQPSSPFIPSISRCPIRALHLHCFSNQLRRNSTAFQPDCNKIVQL